MARLTLILGVLATVVYLLDGFRFMLNEWRTWRNKGTWVAVLGLCLVPTMAEAATITAATCGSADVQSALNTAESNGDPSNIVQIPSGTCGWATTVEKSLTKDLILQGQGEVSTIIQDNTAGSILLNFTSAAGKSLRVTAFTFDAGTNVIENFTGALLIGGSSSTIRVDHMTFKNMTFQVKYVHFTTCTYGLVDHITTLQTRTISNGVAVDERSCGGKDFGHYNWSLPDPWNSPNCIFIEDSSFDENVGGRLQVLSTVNDAGESACVVVRYNTISNLFVQNHGTFASTRGGRHLEVYNNTFRFLHGYNTSNQAVWFESGTGVVYNNTIPASWTVSTRFLYDRTFSSLGSWGKCDGTSVYDGNTGTPTGYPCVDEPGQGQSILYTGISPPLPASAASQPLSPVYVWNNSSYGTTSQSGQVLINRDYYESAKPSYVAYPYPHPLQGSTDTPATTPAVIARVLRWMEVAAFVTGMGWHFRKQVMAVSLAAIAGCGTLYQLAPRSYETVKIVSKDSAVKVLTVFNSLTKPRD